jgi:hypothetical protein
VLFTKLPALDETLLLPARDPGRFSLWTLLRGKDLSQEIAPNREDFARWKSAGAPALTALDRRHERLMLFSYYLNHLRRFVRVTLLLETLMMAPQIAEVPTYLESVLSWSQQEQVVDSQLRHEVERLRHEIERQEKMSQPDAALIASLKSELQDLVDAEPWTPYAQPDSM